MKNVLKILILVFIVATTILSCSVSPGSVEPPDKNPSPSELNNLQHTQDNIRPTKPIKIPDTLTITNIAPTNPDINITPDSIPQD